MTRFAVALMLMTPLAIFVLSCSQPTQQIQPAHQTPPAPEEIVIAVLVVDYLSHEFEGAALNTYPTFYKFDCTTLPFGVQYCSPADFGYIRFTYLPNMQEVFYGTIVWNGCGSLMRPSHLIPVESLLTVTDSLPQPQCVSRYGWNGAPASNSTDTDPVWGSICKLQLLREFEPSLFRIGYLPYGPSQGVFDPTKANWIVFALGPLRAHSERRLTLYKRSKSRDRDLPARRIPTSTQVD
jgi:hypothetical protein